MPTLKSVRAQIEKLKNEEQRLLEAAMAGSVSKVKKLMASLGVTLEHLGGSVTSAVSKAVGSKPAAKKTRAKRAGVGAAKYRDPATGATWSGFGRAPAWIANAANRDEFLAGATKTAPVKKATAAKKSAKPAPAKKAAKASKPTAAAKKAAKPASKKAAPAKKSPAKKAAAKKAPRASKRATAPETAAADAAAPSASK